LQATSASPLDSSKKEIQNSGWKWRTSSARSSNASVSTQGASPRDIVCSLQSGDLRVSSSRQPEDSFPPPDTEWESIFDSWGTIENEESHQGLVLPACLQASTNPPVSPVSKDLSTPPVTPHPKPDPYESTGILSFPTESPNGGPQPSPPPSCSMLDWVGAVVLVIAQESWRGLWG